MSSDDSDNDNDVDDAVMWLLMWLLLCEQQSCQPESDIECQLTAVMCATFPSTLMTTLSRLTTTFPLMNSSSIGLLPASISLSHCNGLSHVFMYLGHLSCLYVSRSCHVCMYVGPLYLTVTAAVKNCTEYS